MKIRRVILKGVRNFKDFDHSFEDEWSQRVPDALLLSGPNGSGKTTLLESIAGLWRVLFDVLSGESKPLQSPMPFYRTDTKFAAMEIIGLDEEKPVWVFGSSLSRLADEFMASHPDSYRVGMMFFAQDGSFTDNMQDYLIAEAGKNEALGVREYSQWTSWWSERILDNRLGKQSDLPNMVFFDSENRTLPSIKGDKTAIPEPDEFQWLARYEPVASRKGSLQNYLFNLKVVDEVAFKNIVEQVNQFLPNKNIKDFDKRTRQLMVQMKNGGDHPIEDLSSGEKQVLLMLATVTRWLRPGGILLIDEPDLHLHESLTTTFVNHLQRMITDKKGQLILASHAPALRRDFTESHTLRLGKTELEK